MTYFIQITFLECTQQLRLTGEGVKKINECFPSIEMMRFSLSGTEAIQNVFRLARAYTGKQKIVRFLGHFHGRRKGKLLSNMVIVKIKCYEEEGFK